MRTPPTDPATSNVPTHEHLDAAPAALIEARLASSGPCLYVVDEFANRWLPIWPLGFSLDGRDLMGPTGAVASIGDVLQLGGGEWYERDFHSLQPLLVDPIPDACRGGNYWLTVDVAAAQDIPAP